MRIILAIGVVVSMLADFDRNARAADTSAGDQMIAVYFQSETQKLAEACLANVKTWQDWTSQRETCRQQLREMLGLDPLPEWTPLNAVVTGRLDRDNFTVEKLHFQSRPHLYVTANLYLPKNGGVRAPAILYVCGHSAAKKGGVSFGNKTKYQHHGAWFARNGYVCLVIDTLQLGEIEGVHHGTYRQNMWSWNARGYTPAGVETWNSIRAIDYLMSRPEVDPNRIGMTGRSGGGAYTWFASALDDRIKVAVPVAGITNLKNHVVDNCVEGHCDCMYAVNTYRWDYAQLAAMTAPRPLLISNTDRDHIFPLDGVVDIYERVRRLYELADMGSNVALQVAAGPHSDGQVLQLHAMQWFNHYLKGESPLIETAARSYFTPQELKVFDMLPDDQINTRIQESFAAQADTPPVPASEADWESQRDNWMKAALRDKCFRGWPEESHKNGAATSLRQIRAAKVGGANVTVYQFASQDHVELQLSLLEPAGIARRELTKITLQPLDESGWTKLSLAIEAETGKNERHKVPPWPDTHNLGTTAWAFVAPRGIGPTKWNIDPKTQTHIRRRFMLLGQTLDGMRVWDVRRAIQTLRGIDGLAGVPLVLKADDEMAGIALYAALFEPNIARIELRNLSNSHRTGPDFLNVLRFLDVPQAVAMAAEKSNVEIEQDDNVGWAYPLAVAGKLGWNDRIRIVEAPANSTTVGSTRSK